MLLKVFRAFPIRCVVGGFFLPQLQVPVIQSHHAGLRLKVVGSPEAFPTEDHLALCFELRRSWFTASLVQTGQ